MARMFKALILAICMQLPSTATAFQLSIDITQVPGEPYEDAIAIIKRAGADATSLSVFWDDLEQIEGRYSPTTDWPAIANTYYSSIDMPLTLTFSVIDTTADRRPEAYKGLAWDDPRLIAEFGRHIDDVMARLSDIDILSVSIGNEVNGYLATNPQITAYAKFLAAAKDRVLTWRPKVSVGTKLTFSGLQDHLAAWQPILDASHGLHVTYYPLGPDFGIKPNLNVQDDLALLIRAADGQPIYILEAGYPSEGCGAPADGQTRFVEDLLAAAAASDGKIDLVSLTWLTDIPTAQVDVYQSYYKTKDPCFAAYLGSLGLRTETGAPKDALQWLMDR